MLASSHASAWFGNPAVDPKLLSLDIYAPARSDRCKALPTLIWVHGGGWAIGDKSNQLESKRKLFASVGYMLVSINYRLSPVPSSLDPNRIKYPIHPRDVASAVAW